MNIILSVLRRSTRSVVSLLALALMIFCAVLAPATAHAGLMAYEGFNYTAGTGNLTGQSGGSGWSNTWQTVNSGSADVVASSLAAGASAPSGYDGQSIGNRANLPNNRRVGRWLDRAAGGAFGSRGYIDANGRIGADGKTLYLSFMQQPNGTTSYYEFEFHRDNLGDAGRIGGIGNDQGTATSVYLRAPNATHTAIGAGSTAVNFYVVRIDFKSGNDDIRVYRNPTSTAEPGTPTLTKLAQADMSFNGISFGAFSNSRTVAHDEVRIGETWDDVTPGHLTWVGDGSLNNWDLATANWTGGSGSALFTNGAPVVFDDTGSNSPAVNLASTVSPSSIAFNNSLKDYTISGTGAINSSGSLLKLGTGTATLSATTTVSTLNANYGKLSITTNANVGGNSGTFYVGNLAGTSGTLTLEPGSSLVVTGALADAAVVGRDGGIGTIIQNGGTFTYNPNNRSDFYLGASGNAATISTYSLTNGTLDLSSKVLHVGFGSGVRITGNFNVAGGQVLNVGGMYIGESSGTGVVNVVGGTLNTSAGGYMRVGNANGPGKVTQTNGDVTVNAYYSMGLGGGSDGTGSYNISGGSLTAAADFTVHEANTSAASSSSFTQSGGTVNLNGVNKYIGRAATGGGQGIYSLSGGILNIGSAGDLQVAGFYTGANGVLNVSGTGQLNINGVVALALARTVNSTGTVNQTGGTVNIPAASTLGLWLGGGGGGANAIYNLNGGTLALGTITPNAAAATTALKFDGGTLRAQQGFTVPSVANFTNVINGNGATVDTAGFSVIWTPPLLAGTGAGGLTKLGAGSLTLSGTNTYAGTTIVSNGTLFINGSVAGGVTNYNGTLGGTGTILGPVLVATDGTIAPGASIGTLSIRNDVTLQGTALMEIGRSVATPISDLIAGVRTLTCGGTLSVMTNASLGPFVPGDIFKLFDATNYASSFATTNLPLLPEGWSWDTSKLTVDGTLSVVGQLINVVLVTQPQNLVLPVGSNGTFSVIVTGAPPFFYQWYHGTSQVAGAVSDTLNLTNVRAADAGGYWVVVTNDSSSATSAVATLTLTLDLLLAYEGFDYAAGAALAGQNGGFGWGGAWTQIEGAADSVVSGNLGGGASVPSGYDALSQGNHVLNNEIRDGRFLNVTANGAFGLSGYLDGNGNVGADGKTLYVSFLQQPNGTTYFYEFEFHRDDLNNAGRIGGIGNDSGNATGVYLRTPATGQTLIGAGDTSVNFYVVRIDFKSGNNDEVRVYRNPTSSTEPGTPTLTKLSAGDMSFDGISFGAFVNSRTVRHDEVRVGTTWASVLGVLSGPPVIRTQPLSLAVLEGSNATFTIAADGSAPFAYYWLKDGSDAGITANDSLTINNAQFTDTANYSVIVSNDFGSVTSSVARLTVYTVSNNLLAHWKLDEISGLTAYDATPNHFDGTLLNYPGDDSQWQFGLVGDGALLLNTNNRVQIASNPSLNPDSFTISFWMQLNSPVTNMVNVLARERLSGCASWGVEVYSNNVLNFFLFGANGPADVKASTLLQVGPIYHIACRFSHTNVMPDIFVNGLLVSTNRTSSGLNGPPAYDTGALMFGGARAGGGCALAGTFDGLLDDVQFYNKPLTDGEIAYLFSDVGSTLGPLTVSGQVALEAFTGPARDGAGTRSVTFKATDATGAVLGTWDQSLTFAAGADGYGVAPFTLTSVPAGTAQISAKSPWNLRKRLTVAFLGGAGTASFTGVSQLPGGDLDGSNVVDLTDYFQLATAWYQVNAAADIDGSGMVDLDDYFIMANHWNETTDPE